MMFILSRSANNTGEHITKVKRFAMFNYSAEKNALLKAERDISFDEVIAAIQNGQVLDVIRHPNKKKYPHQELMVIRIRGYVHMVPFLEQQDGSLFLKTVYPSRKAGKHYMSGGDGHEKSKSDEKSKKN